MAEAENRRAAKMESVEIFIMTGLINRAKISINKLHHPTNGMNEPGWHVRQNIRLIWYPVILHESETVQVIITARKIHSKASVKF